MCLLQLPYSTKPVCCSWSTVLLPYYSNTILVPIPWQVADVICLLQLLHIGLSSSSLRPTTQPLSSSGALGPTPNRGGPNPATSAPATSAPATSAQAQAQGATREEVSAKEPSSASEGWEPPERLRAALASLASFHVSVAHCNNKTKRENWNQRCSGTAYHRTRCVVNAHHKVSMAYHIMFFFSPLTT